jgi:hypothetical protein
MDPNWASAPFFAHIRNPKNLSHRISQLFRWSFIRTRGFEFMASGFLLLDGWDTLRLWSRM